ncbi:hypothetical protein J7I94_14605 [Streptomyces sp. ISL-12]|uniref:hypothetical protein n=1 Tax=Streptomyces sp. ISL-12 TaxID=2819177 RepID=UPI001BE997A3|nr:hypothetical protein [Streptomyces sp. ISL-12]MBT2411784.1 hypothetical protein [Streptomyces sp. ISL-12]
MDISMAAVVIVLVMAATAVLVVKILSSAPARIAATLAAVAVLFAVVPRILDPLTPPAADTTQTVAPRELVTAPSVESAVTDQPGSPSAREGY